MLTGVCLSGCDHEVDMTCSVCNVEKPITLEHGVKWGKGWIRWFICVPCELRERENGDARASEAINQAEKAGV